MPIHPRPDTAASHPAPRRSRGLALAGLALALAGALWAGRDQLASHWAWWFGGAQARIAMDYAGLSPALDEAALQQRFGGASLHCAGTPQQRICDAGLARADGVPAARLRLTLQDGRLQQAEVFVPWWAHHAAARALVGQLGAPTSVDAAAPDVGQPRMGQQGTMAWELARGTLCLPRAPGWNPWQWTVLRWTPAPKAGA